MSKQQNLVPQINYELIAHTLGVSAKNIWFYAKTYGGIILKNGLMAMGAVGEAIFSGGHVSPSTMVSISSLIDMYVEATAERAKGIVAVKENEGGELIIRAIYKMNPANDRKNPIWNAIPVVSHAIGLEPKPKNKLGAYTESDDDMTHLKASGRGLLEVEVIEDFVSDPDEEREQQMKFGGFLKDGDELSRSVEVGSKLDEKCDDGSYLVIVLDKEKDEEEQIKELEKNIAERKCDVTVVKKKDVLEENSRTYRSRSSSPVVPLMIGPDKKFLPRAAPAEPADNNDNSNNNGGDDDDDDDDDYGKSFRGELNEDDCLY